MKAKKISDKQRLDWMTKQDGWENSKIWRGASGTWYFEIDTDDKDYANGETLRQAIDAAMRSASRKKGGK